MLTYGSVCSGIEAASVAWECLGFKPLWFSEIEPFPCAVLAHHWPDIPNNGDMTTLADRILNREIPAPDILVGGTPCQAFSVAGLRQSLNDDRGNLTLEMVRILNAIDTIRRQDGKQPAILVWENVPGVLSTKDNALGCFLGAIAGEDVPIQPAGKKWTGAGFVSGQNAISPGVPLMLNFSECPSDAVESSLSQVLEKTSVSQKYYLSPKACAGILRRSLKKKWTLPKLLQHALVCVVMRQ